MNNNFSVPLFTNSSVSTSRIIHTPSVFARSNLIHLQEVGTLSALAPHTSSRTNLQSYLFFAVTKGSGSITYEHKSYELHTGDCVFIDCRKEYSHCSSDDLWSLSWVHFYGPTMNAIYDKYLDRGGEPVFHCREYSQRVSNDRSDSHSERFDEYRQLLKTIFATAATESYVRDVQLAEKLTGLIVLLMEDAWHPRKTTQHPAPKRISVAEVKEYIDTHYQEKLTLESMSKQFYINKHYLTRIFREQYGYSLNAYIIHVRIGKAKEQLRFSDKTVEEIGYACGFDDRNYFARCFRKVEGISPSEYRKSW